MKKIIPLFLILITCCWEALSQQQVEVPLQKPCPYGYLEYKPEGARALLVSLHGIGKRGNGTTELYKVAQEGVAKVIRDGKFTHREFVVVSPQLPTGQNMFSYLSLKAFIDQMIIKHNIDTAQVYMVGLSAGANSIYPYITTLPGIKAAVAYAGYGNFKKACMTKTRVWAFHGESDGIVVATGSILFVTYYNRCSEVSTGRREPSRLTIYPGLGHTGWQETFSLSWMNMRETTYDPFDQDIYEWLLGKRPPKHGLFANGLYIGDSTGVFCGSKIEYRKPQQ